MPTPSRAIASCRRLLTVAFTLALTPAIPAAILLSDPFAGHTGPLHTLSGWEVGLPPHGDSRGHERPFQVRNGELLWDGNLGHVNAVLVHQLAPRGQRLRGQVFVGFDLVVHSVPFSQVTAVAPATFLCFSNESGKSQRALIGVVPGSIQGGFRVSLGHSQAIDTDDILPNEFFAGQTIRVVVGYNIDNRVASVWLDPASATQQPNRILPPAGNSGISALTVRMRNPAADDLGSLSLSRLVVATTFAEAR